MKKFFSVEDVPDLGSMLEKAKYVKANPFEMKHLGQNKTLGLVFLNPSLRTRLSTQKAAANLGMHVMVMNMGQEGWALETQDGIVMNGHKAEHIREAAAVIGQYCDIIGLRSFPGLKNKEVDYSETLFHKFMEFCGRPVISLESATRHPLQSFADLLTIEEHKPHSRPKVVMSWAPHIKALPQAVPNSFAEWMGKAQEQGLLDFAITHPQGYELSESFTANIPIYHEQEKALENADFIYVKNWSSYKDYGKIYTSDSVWMLDRSKLKSIPEAKILHCLPVRRDLELASELLDGPESLVISEAGNRLWAAQTVLQSMLESLI